MTYNYRLIRIVSVIIWMAIFIQDEPGINLRSILTRAFIALGFTI